MAAGLIALPMLTAENRAYWTAGADGELHIAWCEACSRYHHPPSPACPNCRSMPIVTRPVSGRATLVTYTVNHQPWHPALPNQYVTAFVAIDEQPDVWLMTNIVDCAEDALAIGMKLEVTFRQLEDVWLPLFRPQADMAGGGHA